MNNTEKIFSLHLNSNKPQKFENFSKSFLNNISNPNSLEILVHIDKDDISMKKKISELNKDYKNPIRYIETNIIKNFNDAWKPLNLLKKETSSSVKIIACLSDDIIINTENWDLVLLKYLQENKSKEIFRIRCSQYKNVKYSNIWECGFKPDFSFYTKKWVDTVGCWSPCIGPDTYQETVSFYLNRFGNKYNKSIVDNKINFDGEKILTGLNIHERIKRTKLGYKSFSELISYKVQKKALKAAKKLAQEIHKEKIEFKEINYLNHVSINFIKKLRFFHFRGSKGWLTSNFIFNILFIIWCKIDTFDDNIISFIKLLEKKNLLNKIITNKYQYEKLIEALKNSE